MAMQRRWVGLWVGALTLAATMTLPLIGSHVEAQVPRAAGSGPTEGAAAATLTVQGKGKVPVRDLQAYFTVGVSERAATAQAAMSEDNAVMQRVLQALAAKGVHAAQLTTTALSLGPVYGQEPAGSTTPPPIVAFEAEDAVQVRVPQVQQLGTLLDAALAAGANQLDGVSFAPRSVSALEREALADAVRDARDQAVAMARAAGLTLGAVSSISSVVQLPPVLRMPGFIYGASAMAAPSTPVYSGSQTVSAEVTATFTAVPASGVATPGAAATTR